MSDASTSLKSALIEAISAFAELEGGGEGLFRTPIQGVDVIRTFRDTPPNHMVYRPSLCVVVQGTKQILFGEDVLNYGAMQCLIVNVEMPACGRIIEASAAKPFLGVTIDIDPGVLRQVIEQLDSPPTCAGGSARSLFVGDVNETLADCVLRIIRLLSTPKAIPILYPSVMRELCYWLLTSEHGAEIATLGMPETHVERITQAIRVLRENYARTIRIEELAEATRMSPSSFHQHFKSVTSMTPLQYQKQLRLLEARRLMVVASANVAEAAHQVGYESTSQFSREYSRMFGTAPKRNTMDLRVAGQGI